MNPYKIWYDDGSTFSSDDGNPEDAPMDGAQAILQWLPNGNYEIIPPNHYYWWMLDRWVSGSQSGIDRYLRKRDHKIIIIFGRWTSSALFQQIQKEVHLDIEEEKIVEENNIDGSI